MFRGAETNYKSHFLKMLLLQICKYYTNPGPRISRALLEFIFKTTFTSISKKKSKLQKTDKVNRIDLKTVLMPLKTDRYNNNINRIT